MRVAQHACMRTKETLVPKTSAGAATKEARSHEVCLSLIASLLSLRQAMLDLEIAFAASLESVQTQYRLSARNLVHYLALRSVDLRPVQEKLAWLGLSSLGRAESHVLASVDKVLGVLHYLTDQPWTDRSSEEPVGSVSGRRLAERHCIALLGAPNPHRRVRIMVTLPSEAALDYGVVRELVQAGMDIARINCAHDDAAAWKAMASNVKRAAKAAERKVQVLMDLGGSKIRTGEVQPRPAVLKLKPHRDMFGRVFHPAKLGLIGDGCALFVDNVDASIEVDRDWLERLAKGRHVEYVDARGAKRHLLVVLKEDEYAVADSIQTAYLTPETVLSVAGSHGKKMFRTLVGPMDQSPGTVHLQMGEKLRLTHEGLGCSAVLDDNVEEQVREAARISCTLPEIFEQVRVGERIWFDDGRIGGVIQQASPLELEIEIVQARPGGERLAADKGINLPDSELRLPALSAKDIEGLETVVQCADMVGSLMVRVRIATSQ